MSPYASVIFRVSQLLSVGLSVLDATRKKCWFGGGEGMGGGNGVGGAGDGGGEGVSGACEATKRWRRGGRLRRRRLED